MQIVITGNNRYFSVHGANLDRSEVLRLFPTLTEGTYEVTIKPGTQFWLAHDNISYKLDTKQQNFIKCYCGRPNCKAFATFETGLLLCRTDFEQITGIKLEPCQQMQVDIELQKSTLDFRNPVLSGVPIPT